MNRRDFAKSCAYTALAKAALTRASSIANPGYQQDTAAENSLQRTDAYVQREGMTWVLGTSKAERKLEVGKRGLLLTSLRNKISGREYRDAGSDPEEIKFRVDGTYVSALMSEWKLISEHNRRLAQGELQFDITLRTGPVDITKHWVIYPNTAIVREWLTIQNVSAHIVSIEDLHFMNISVLGRSPEEVELDYISGGGNYNGSQLLKTEHVHATYHRIFDSNTGVQSGSYSAYLPLVLLRNTSCKDSLAVGWDYMGHWSLRVGEFPGEPTGLGIQVAGYHEQLKPGDRIETPKAFTAAMTGDLDAIGNQILDWQYQYMWEFTTAAYFGKTRWAVDWPNPWIGDGGTPSADNWGRRLALDLRYTDLMRECGGDILWDDAGWYDHWGDWNGPDWSLTTAYLRKHGMSWVLWYPTFLANQESKVAEQHPEWMIPSEKCLDQSILATAVWQKKLLDQGVAEWQDFQWRYDIAPAAAATDAKLLAADQNFRRLLEEFKKAHPNSGVDACDGGGRWISYDIARLSESGEYTDGGVGPYSGYYTSLLISPDKLHNVTDFDHTYYNASSDRTHLAMTPNWYRDPGDGDNLESIRKDWEIYHYLIVQGVAGRGSHIFRPPVANDDPIWYVQRMNAEGSRGIIISKHAKRGAEYFLVSQPMSNTSQDQYEGGPTAMTEVFTTKVARLDTGIYADPVDKGYRYYGVPGETYGPMNFRYLSEGGEESYVTQIGKHGMRRQVDTSFFGMAFQLSDEPIIISALGLYSLHDGFSGDNRGVYSMMLIRAGDLSVVASTTLDMSVAPVDSLGFKFARLASPVRLEPELDKPVIVFPRGLRPETTYEVNAYHAKLTSRQSGQQLMAKGISLPEIQPGELIFLNLSDYPGSWQRKGNPNPPSKVTKRVGTNLGKQGIEVAWIPSGGDRWISYYQILRDGLVIGKSAKGEFFFDHRHGIDVAVEYQVRTIDGDGNRSALASAALIAGEPERHQPLGEFGPSRTSDGWRYEETSDGQHYEELVWSIGGYEGLWSGSGLGRIGRMWMQPSATVEIVRTYAISTDCSVHISGTIQKDPSAAGDCPVEVKIEHAGQQIWPAIGWAAVPLFGKPESYRLEILAAHKGEAFRFIVKRSGSNRPQPIIWNPMIEVHSN